MDSFWKGTFLPVAKHRLGTGDIRNHVEIRSKEVVEVEEDKYVCVFTAGYVEGEEVGEYIMEMNGSFPPADGILIDFYLKEQN